MKKSLLVLVLIAAFCHVKAQQLFPTKPGDSPNNNVLQKYFQTKPDAQQQLFQLNVNPVKVLPAVNPQLKVSGFDNMPIAFLQGNTKMPVAKLGGYYKMPIAKLGRGDTSLVEVNKITP